MCENTRGEIKEVALKSFTIANTLIEFLIHLGKRSGKSLFAGWRYRTSSVASIKYGGNYPELHLYFIFLEPPLWEFFFFSKPKEFVSETLNKATILYLMQFK